MKICFLRKARKLSIPVGGDEDISSWEGQPEVRDSFLEELEAAGL